MEKLTATVCSAAVAGAENPQPTVGDTEAAVRPYPVQYVAPWIMKDGIRVTIRPIRPEDEAMMVKFHETLSERTVFHRYFQVTKLSRRVSHARLMHICFADYDQEIPLVVEAKTPGGAPLILAVGRLSKLEGGKQAEIAVLVSDQYQRRGLGAELMRRLIAIARAEGVHSLIGYQLQENIEMRGLIQKFGFSASPTKDPSVLLANLEL